MKNIIYLLLTCFVFSSCSSIKHKKVIPYFISTESEFSIYENIKNLKKDHIVFYFENIGDKKFKIHLFNDNVEDQYSFSNRKIFINDTFYPLIFDTDYIFFVKTKNNYPVISKFNDDSERNFSIIKIPNIEERVKNSVQYLKDTKYNIIDFSTYWIIDNKGKLIETNSK